MDGQWQEGGEANQPDPRLNRELVLTDLEIGMSKGRRHSRNQREGYA